MEELKNIGYIYKITNLVNGKVYIGQTKNHYNKRFKEHKSRYNQKYRESYKYPLYKAFRKYGLDNFKFEVIEKCLFENLDEREIYWISFYDSFNKKKGYNQTLGGGGFNLYNFNEQEIIDNYYKLKDVTKVAEKFKCCNDVISSILKKNSIYIETSKDKGINISRYSLKGEFLESYNSMHEAALWIKENCNEFKDKSSINISYCLKRSILCKTDIFANFLWKSSEISEEEKELFISKQMEYESNRIYDSKKAKMYYENSKVFCPICKINLKSKESEYCNNCRKEIRNNNFKKVPKEKLMQLVREKSFIEIGKMYDVSDNTIKKWCKKYFIPYRKEDIRNILDKDWIKECSLSKEEYETKYCQSKEKEIYLDEEIIKSYISLKSINKVSKLCNKDEKTIKRILEKNNIEIVSASKSFLSEGEFLCRVDIETNNILESYPTYKEAVEFIQQTNNGKYKTVKDRLRIACQNGTKAYGYFWRKELREN